MDDSVLLLDNDDVESILDMADLIPRLEGTYVALGEDDAANAPRVDVSVPTDRGGTYHRLKTMSGALPREGVQAVRIDSDLFQWPTVDGTVQREKVTKERDDDLRIGAENGLVVLYSVETAEPLLLVPDGQLQRFRVGATSGLAADYLAREDATTVGLLGSGWQASAQVLALDAVRDLTRIDVYSPTPENREEFAAKFDDLLEAEVRAVESADTAVEGKDVIDAATDSLSPVIDPDWLDAGVHVSSVKKQELTNAVFERSDVTIVHTAEQTGEHNVVVEGETPIPEFEVDDRWWTDTSTDVWEGIQPLSELATGEARGRGSDDDVTLFANNIGLGTQFAACAHLLYERARDADVGEDLPIGWFLQDIA